MCRMNTLSGLVLVLVVAGAGSVQADWASEKDEIMAAEMLLTRVYYDMFKLGDYGLEPAELDFSFSISSDAFAYEFAGGQSYLDEPLTLSGVGQRNGDQWTGVTSGSLGSDPINMPWESNIEWVELGANCDWHTGVKWVPDSSWTVEYSPGGGFATSTHANGGKDRGVKNGDTGKWEWTITQEPTADDKTAGEAAMATPAAYPGSDVGTLSIVPEPGSLGLLALGGALLAGSRRCRFWG